MEKGNYVCSFTEQEKATLEYLSKTILSGARPYELEILKSILTQDSITVESLQKKFAEKYGYEFQMNDVEKAVDVLQGHKNYVDGKPDYADVFEDNMIFLWDSQMGKGIDSTYMQDVITAKRRHLFVKKSDAESSFYYMGQFDIIDIKEAQKENNKGKKEVISKVRAKMHHPVREDLFRYLQSGITIEENAG